MSEGPQVRLRTEWIQGLPAVRGIEDIRTARRSTYFCPRCQIVDSRRRQE